MLQKIINEHRNEIYIYCTQKLLSYIKYNVFILSIFHSIIQDISNVTIPDDIDLLPPQMYTWIQTTDKFSIKSILHEAVLNGAYDW